MIQRCSYHKTGIPTYANGRRFFAENCEVCAEKLAQGKVSRDDPTPMELMKRHGYGRNQDGRRLKVIENMQRRRACAK